jgi:hypothetical protein
MTFVTAGGQFLSASHGRAENNRTIPGKPLAKLSSMENTFDGLEIEDRIRNEVWGDIEALRRERAVGTAKSQMSAQARLTDSLGRFNAILTRSRTPAARATAGGLQIARGA